VIALLLMGCLAEMTSEHPTPGSFGDYAEFYLSPLWIPGALLLLVLRGAGGGYRGDGHWNVYAVLVPAYAGLALVLLFSALVMVINVIGVKWFGQVEYALSTIKVLAIVAFIVIGLGSWPSPPTQPTACIILPMAVGLCRLGSAACGLRPLFLSSAI
jgi:L-asparagine transporter-like permease